jgi:PAS domain S-box-containing protein
MSRPTSTGAVLVVFTEITETRRAERRFRQLIDGLFTFVGLCDVDGTLLEANEFALRAAGLEAADVIGRPFWDCHWWSHDTEVQQLVRQAVADAATGQRCRFDTSVLVTGGRGIPIDFQLVPVIEDGRVISLVPSGLDIEARATQVRNLSELSALAADLHDALGCTNS